MVRSSLLLITIITSHLIAAQSNPNKGCSLSIDIPDQFLVISADEKEVVYRDKKTNGILSLTKVSLTNYEFDLGFTASKVYEELNGDGNYIDVEQEFISFPETDVAVVDWTRSETSPNRRNDFYSMAMMDVCGHYYNFKYAAPRSKKTETRTAFKSILDTIRKEKVAKR